MALADYLLPYERVAAECGRVAATNLRLISYNPRSGGWVFRELPYSFIETLKLRQRPRATTVVLGTLIALLSLLAGPGTTLQLAAAGLGAASVLLGIVFGDLSLEIATSSNGAKPQRWPLREVSRRESEALVAVARAAMNGEYDFVPEPAPLPLAEGALGRSVLLVPMDDALSTLEALAGDADVICLDNTTLVHPSRREVARWIVQSAVGVAGQARRRAWVRVSRDEAAEDLAAAVWPGLTAVVVSVESPEEATALAWQLDALELERGLAEQVRIVVQVETAAGAWALGATLAASPRVCAVIAATHDALDLLGRQDARSVWNSLRAPALPEAAHLRGRIAAAALAAGVPVYACLATDVAPGWLADALGGDALRSIDDAAGAASAHGYRGAITLHPEAIEACNAVFPVDERPSAPSPTAPSPWQPVVPSHFGIGVPRPAPEESATDAQPVDAPAPEES